MGHSHIKLNSMATAAVMQYDVIVVAFSRTALGFCINNFNPIFSVKFRKADFKSFRALTLMLCVLFAVRTADTYGSRTFCISMKVQNECFCFFFAMVAHSI